MSPSRDPDPTEEGVRADLQRQPHLLLKLAENSLRVAENLRDNYFKNTTVFVKHLRQRIRAGVESGEQPVLSISQVDGLDWSALRGEVVTFIDGGIGNVELSSQIPILLRVGSYSVKTGEHRLAEREHFGYYPVILGDLEGGSKERKDFPDIVRITAELLGGLSVLEQNPELALLMFHGPLVYMMGAYAGHTPFTEADIDLFLQHYAGDGGLGASLKDAFLKEARIDIYPKLTARPDEWADRRVFEPLSWIAFLYRRMLTIASARSPRPIIVGVVERGGTLRDFSETVLLERIFKRLRSRGHADYFNKMFGRRDLTTPRALLDRLGYSDALLLGLLLKPGQRSEAWRMANKYSGLRRGNVALPGESHEEVVDFSSLAREDIGFPAIDGFYVHVSDTTEPIRVEMFASLGEDPIEAAAKRCYLYARLEDRATGIFNHDQSRLEALIENARGIIAFGESSVDLPENPADTPAV